MHPKTSTSFGRMSHISVDPDQMPKSPYSKMKMSSSSLSSSPCLQDQPDDPNRTKSPTDSKTPENLKLMTLSSRLHVHMATAYFKYASIRQLSFMSCTLAVSVFQLCVVLYSVSFCSCSYVLCGCAVSSVWLPTTELWMSNSAHATRHLFGLQIFVHSFLLRF